MRKTDPDSTSADKVLRLFLKLLGDGRRHYQKDLSEELNCSLQTVMRLTEVIEGVVGEHLTSGIDKHKRWYQLNATTRSRLGLQFEELRYLSICRDLAEPYLGEDILKRVNDTIFNLSMFMADTPYESKESSRKKLFSFSSKGRIDYKPFYKFIEQISQAIDSKGLCNIRYKASGAGEVKRHLFAPYKLVCMNGALYALGSSVTEDGTEFTHPVSYAVHRIKDLEFDDRTIPGEFNDTDYELGSFGLPWHEPRTFKITFKKGKTADYVRERIWADEQKVTDLENGDLLLEITTRSEPELMAWVRSFGENAALLS